MQPTQPMIGPYQIVSELGQGGMAIVYRAIDTRTNREIALKLLLPQFVDDETFLQRFLREGQNTKRLRHPNIVRTFDAGEIDGQYFIAMEVVEGSNLAEYVKAKGALLKFSETIDILSQVSSALDYAHSLGFLHRDIKLTNILMGRDGRALLSDFGAAKQISADYTMITATGQSIGTPSYMSPEQARAEINLDFRTDVYSLGVVAFKLFTGRMPFVADSQPELLYKIVYDPIPDPELYNDEIPKQLGNVLKRVLSKKSELRYESAGTFVSAIVASKRWRLNVAEDLTKSLKTTSTRGLRAKTGWRGISLAVGTLATVVIVLALSSTVRTQDSQTLDMAGIVDGVVSEVADASESISAIELPEIELPEIPISAEDLPQLPIGEVGKIDIRGLDTSMEVLSDYWEKAPGRAELSAFGQSVLDLIPGLDGEVSGVSTTSTDSNGEDLVNPTAVANSGAKPPLVPILPSLPSP